MWIASELMYPETTSTGYYVTAIAQALAADGPVTVLCGQPTYLARGTRAPRAERWHGVDIRRCAGTTFDKNRLPGRLANMATLTTSIGWAALRGVRRGDLAVVLTNPPTLPFFVAAACRVRGCRYVLLIHDQYPDTLVATTSLSDDAWSVRLMRRMNRWLFAGASRIVVVGRDMQARIERQYPSVATPIDVIPNWAESETVRPADRAENALLRELGLTDRFVALYAGNLGRPNDIETIVHAAERLRDEPRFHFLFVGAGARQPALERAVRDLGLRNVTLAGTRPREAQHDFLNAGDVAVVPFVAGMLGVAVPSRLYNVLAAGTPVIGIVESGSEVDQVIREEGVGWVTPPGEVEPFVAALREAAADPERLAGMARRARQAAEDRYSGGPSLDAYRDLARDVMAPAVLVHHLGSLGDTLITIPALRAIRAEWPAARVVMLHNRRSVLRSGGVSPKDVLEGLGLVDEFVSYERFGGWRESIAELRRFWRVVRRLRPEAVVFVGPSERLPSALRRDRWIYRAAGCRRVYGFAPLASAGAEPHETVRKLARLADDGLAEAARTAHLATPLLSFEAGERREARAWLDRAGIPVDRLVAVGPESDSPSKRWPQASFEELGRRLLAAGWHPMVVGSRSADELVHALIGAWGGGFDARGLPTIKQSAAVLASCRGYVGLDSGASHLAAAAGIRCVVLSSGHGAPGRWDPLGDGHTVLRVPTPCEGCGLAQCSVAGHPCMTGLDVDRVWRATEQMLGATRA